MTDRPQTHETIPALVQVPMPITTSRLILRPPQAGDGAELAEAIRETWTDLKRWNRWAKDFDENVDPQKREQLCVDQHAKFIRREDMMLFAYERVSGAFVGGTGLYDPDWLVRRFEIGYWVRKSAQGQGYATEITNALLRYAFTALAANMVTIGHAEGNDRSRRVIEKCGFQYSHGWKYGHALPDDTITADRIYIRENLEGLPDLDVRW